MKQNIVIVSLLILGTALMLSFRESKPGMQLSAFPDSLRALYEKGITSWPAPFIDEGITWKELGPLPPSPLNMKDSVTNARVTLGKMLFFDPRLSSSNQISCSSCHDPDMHWTDGRSVALGHDHKQGNRNTPSVEFTAFASAFFWDGRAASLDEQALGPLSNPIEMHADMQDLPGKIYAIKGYHPLFKAAFGNDNISLKEITAALAMFQRSIRTMTSDFDRFTRGKKEALSNQQLWGLHLFRTKARCMNCHNGPLFTDGNFHNIGFSLYGERKQDLGLYSITGNTADVGKFKTPGLRNVLRTGPWLHNGMFSDIKGLLNTYIKGMPHPKRSAAQENDPLFPETSPLLHQLDMNEEERDALLAFLESITTQPFPVNRPQLPE